MHHQMPGRGWRAGESCGDGEPEGRDRPLEKGVGGIDSGARSVSVWDSPNEKYGLGGLTKALRKRKANFPFLSAFTIFAS